MYLSLIAEYDDSTLFRISEEANPVPGSGQDLLFFRENRNVKFIGPGAGFHDYLCTNMHWLQRILSRAAGADKNVMLTIPFTFPSHNDKRTPDPGDYITACCDGSCNADGSGGWASIIVKPDGGTIELSGSEKNSTSNRMELMAACMAVEKTLEIMHIYNKKSVMLFTDSVYVIKGITHRFEVWGRNGFITATGTPVSNADLCRKLLALTGKTDVFCEYIRSGSGHIYHGRCDYLAREESRNSLLTGYKAQRRND